MDGDVGDHRVLTIDKLEKKFFLVVKRKEGVRQGGGERLEMKIISRKFVKMR